MVSLTANIFELIPNSLIDDFFIFGFVGGIIGYLYYLFVSKNDDGNHLNFAVGIYGTFLSGCLGGLLAIVFDYSFGLSIIVGLLNQLIYMALIRSAKSGNFWKIIKEVLVRYLTGGKGL